MSKTKEYNPFSNELMDLIEGAYSENSEFANRSFKLLIKVSRPKDLPLQPLAKRCVNLSIHTASIKQTITHFYLSNVQTNMGFALLPYR